MNNNKVLITGASGGIGKSLCKKFIESNAIIICTSSDTEKLKNLKNLYGSDHHYYLLNFADKDSISDSIKQISEDHEDIYTLINNAGIIGSRDGLKKVEMDDHLDTFQTNTLGPLFVTKHCRSLLGKGSTVVNISSLMGSIDDSSGGSYSYRISKAALNMVTKNLHQDLNSKGITVVAFHPGWVRTRMGRSIAPVSKKRSVSGMLKVLEEQNDISGKFINFKGEELPW